jgi:hypothetical protein
VEVVKKECLKCAKMPIVPKIGGGPMKKHFPIIIEQDKD